MITTKLLGLTSTSTEQTNVVCAAVEIREFFSVYAAVAIFYFSLKTNPSTLE